MILKKTNNIFNMNVLTKILLGVIVITSLHWLLMQLYLYMCAGNGLWGFFYSFITMGSPLCQFINFIQYEISKQYIVIWGTAATTLLAWLMTKIKI